MEIFKLFGSILIKDEEALSKLDKVDKKGSSTGITFDKIASAAVTAGKAMAAMATAAVTGLTVMTGKALETANEIIKFSQVTGHSTEAFQEWDHVMKNFGYSMEQANGDLAALGEKAMDAANGAGEGAELFGMLGVSVTDSSGKLKSQEQIFNETITALQGMEDVTKRNAIASALLSTTGEELVPVLNMTNEELQAMKDNANIISDEDLKKAEEFNKSWNDVKNQFSSFSTEIGIMFMPAMQGALGFIQQMMDFTSMFIDELSSGQTIIEAFLTAVSNIFGEHNMIKIEEFINTSGIIPIFETLRDDLVEIVLHIKDSIQPIIQAITDFWSEHGTLIMTVLGVAWTFIKTIIMNTITAIVGIVTNGLSLIDGIINLFQNLFSGNFSACWESIKQIFVSAIGLIWNWMQVQFAVNLPNMIKNFATNIPTLISNMWNSAKNFFSQGIMACLNFVRNLVTNASTNFGTLKTFGANTFQALWSVAKTMMSNLLNSVIQYIRQVPTNISNFMNQAVNKLRSINLFSIGKDMIQGLVNGIKNMGSSVVSAVSGVVNGAINGAKKLLGINSPSKLFTQFGEWTGEGFAIGIDNENNRVTKSVEGLSDSAVAGYANSINKQDVPTLTTTKNDTSIDSNKTLNVNLVMNGQVVANAIAPFTDVVNGKRMDFSERGLAL